MEKAVTNGANLCRREVLRQSSLGFNCRTTPMWASKMASGEAIRYPKISLIVHALALAWQEVGRTFSVGSIPSTSGVYQKECQIEAQHFFTPFNLLSTHWDILVACKLTSGPWTCPRP